MYILTYIRVCACAVLCLTTPSPQVEFLFRNGPVWQPGRVVRCNADGTYDVRCDPFDTDVLLKIQDPPPVGVDVGGSGGGNGNQEEGEARPGLKGVRCVCVCVCVCVWIGVHMGSVKTPATY
jgi:hypothetical protein